MSDSNSIYPKWTSEGIYLIYSQAAIPLPVLSWELFLDLMSYIPVKADLSRYMRTCRSIYHHGIPLLLKQCVFLKNTGWRQIISFCDFMAKDPRRALLLHEIVFPGSFAPADEETPETINKASTSLSRIIIDARNLTILRVQSLRNLLSSNRFMSVAIISHRNIQTIEVGDVDLRGAVMLAKMRSPVTTAFLDFGCTSAEDDDPDDEDLQPSIILWPFREHLEELRLLNLPLYASFKMYDIRFTRVRSLTIETYFPDDFAVEDLAGAFPNLQTLKLHSPEVSPMWDGDSYRELNADAFILPDEKWESLDQLRCDVWWAYGLFFQCPIRMWSGARLGYQKDDISQFRAVIGDIRPRHLDVTIGVSEVGSRRQFQLSGVFPPAEVTHLNINLEALFQPTICGRTSSMDWLKKILVCH